MATRSLSNREEEMVREREFSRSLLESMAAGVVACGADGTLVLFNRTARAWHGLDPMRLPPEEWASHYDLYRYDGVTPLPTDEIPLARAYNGETFADAGMAIVAKGRPPRFILANGCPIVDASGKKQGAVVVMRDVTTLRGAEEALRRSNEELEGRVAERTAALERANEQLQEELQERRRAEETAGRERALLRCVLDSAPDLVFFKDRDGAYRGCNKASEEFLGIPEAGQIGKTDFDFFDREMAEAVRAVDRQVIETGKPVRNEEWVTYPDGREALMDTVKVPYRGPGGELLGLVGIARDITERYRAEQEHRENLKFFESMDEISRALQGAETLEQMMSDVLDAVLRVLDCDRAFLMYPCDPGATTWRAPMERTRPQYPGVLEMGLDVPMDPNVAETLRVMLAADGAVRFGPGTQHPLPEDVSERFGIKCFMSMAVHPKTGRPWQFGIHQCSHVRNWTPQEERLFTEIGRRLETSLTALIIDRDLRESEERYRIVFENSPVSLWEEDFSAVNAFFDQLEAEGVDDLDAHFDRHPESVQHCAELVRVIDLNQAAVELHGAQSKEQLLVGLATSFAPESFDTFRRELVGVWQGKSRMSADAVVRTVAGELRNVTVSYSVCPGYEETLSRILVSLVDITERRRAEEALSASEAELRTLVGAMTDVIIVCNAEGRYLKIPETSPSLLYRPPSELLGKTLHEVFPKERADFFLGHIKQALKTQQSVAFEYSLPIQDREFWFDATISPMSDCEILMVARDITARKQSDEELAKYRGQLEALVRERTAELEAANRELEAFAYSVSHDLRAPLRHIDGFVRLLGDNLGDEVDERTRHFMSVLSSSAGRMGRLIDDLLSFSRMGRAEMAERPVHLGVIVSQVIRDLEPESEGRDVRWQVAELPVVAGDQALLRVVFSNLLGNALKFTRPRKCAEIAIGWEAGESGEVVVFVRDNGVGFDPAYADKLFGVFQRLHRAEDFEGTGIGLANVRRIVVRHGGRVWAEGAPGQGATFFFSLPATRGHEGEA
jgi:PAS domain S-box-containing protein